MLTICHNAVDQFDLLLLLYSRNTGIEPVVLGIFPSNQLFHPDKIEDCKPE
jgi:hypothetical protein